MNFIRSCFFFSCEAPRLTWALLTYLTVNFFNFFFVSIEILFTLSPLGVARGQGTNTQLFLSVLRRSHCVPFHYGHWVRGSQAPRHGRYLHMVLLDRGPDADSSTGLPDKGLEETFHDHLCPRPCAVCLLDVRWRYQLINLCLDFKLNRLKPSFKDWLYSCFKRTISQRKNVISMREFWPRASLYVWKNGGNFVKSVNRKS